MLTALGIALFVLGILVSIALHEVGHLVPAKRSGVKVTQYMVGFGPTLWSTRRGETEYGVKWIPLGGYIRMIGMFPPAPGADPRRLRRASTGPFAQLVEDARTASLEEIAPGDEPRTFYRQPVRRKLLIMLGGPLMNLLLAAVLFTLVLSVIGVPTSAPLSQVGTRLATVSSCVLPPGANRACVPGDRPTPAAAAGLRPGDTIVGFEGEPVDQWEELSSRIRQAGGRTVSLRVERDGQSRDVPVALTTTPREGQQVGFLGVSPQSPPPVLQRRPLGDVPALMWNFTVLTGKAMLGIPQRMVGVWEAAFGGAERDPMGPIGVVGVSRIGGEVAAMPDVPVSFKAVEFLNLLASLNMALFVFNLLPLLPLDGGHAAGALWEGLRRTLARVRGRPDPGPVDVARLLPLAYGVAVLLVGMSVLLLYADVVNPIRYGG